jgi:hypothetical protein
VKKLYKDGERIAPCGTPYGIGCEEEMDLLTQT